MSLWGLTNRQDCGYNWLILVKTHVWLAYSTQMFFLLMLQWKWQQGSVIRKARANRSHFHSSGTEKCTEKENKKSGCWQKNAAIIFIKPWRKKIHTTTFSSHPWFKLKLSMGDLTTSLLSRWLATSAKQGGLRGAVPLVSHRHLQLTSNQVWAPQPFLHPKKLACSP